MDAKEYFFELERFIRLINTFEYKNEVSLEL